MPNIVAELILGCLLVGLFAGCSPSTEPGKATELRGVYVQASSVTSREEADRTLARIEAGRFGDIFVNVFAYGHAYYDSALLEKHPDVAEGFNPLAYLIEQANQQGIRVHAWLVAGPVGNDSPILDKHPEWAMVGPDGHTSNWLNYTRPDVRAFLSDLVGELVQDYAIDGVHFDYARYPGAQYGFDSYSTTLFSEEHGLDPDFLRYRELPAYATFAGNPLIWPATAEVLAEFDNGQPAVLINEYGSGQAILINWDASEREVAAGGEILSRSIDLLLRPDGKLYLMRSGKNAGNYASTAYGTSLRWLEDLGWQSNPVLESEIANLKAGDVLVLPNVYLLKEQTASDLADFVQGGGGVIFVDGPTLSIWNGDVRAITGMSMRGRHFEKGRLLLATREHAIIPTSQQTLPLRSYQDLDAKWKAFRAQGINELLGQVHDMLEKEAPDLVLSISVASDHYTLTQQHLLDWQTWLEEQSVDLIVPRAYVAQNKSLAPSIADWRSSMHDSGQIALAVSTYPIDNEAIGPKTPDQVIAEISTALDRGSAGIVLFDLEHTSDAVLEALADGPFTDWQVGSQKQED